jgi:hypothetical protein
MSNKQFRNIARIAHLIQGVFIALFVYSPLRTDDTYLAIMQFVILPSIIISGMSLWQQPRIMKLLRGDTRTKSA